MMGRLVSAFVGLLSLTLCANAQQATRDSGIEAPPETDAPVANPGRPTVSTPATLTPVGYLQFETGVLSAWTSPEVSSQTSMNEVVKFAVLPRIEFLAGLEPVAHSHVGSMSTNDAGSISLGAQAMFYQGEGAKPTISASYFHSVYGGNAPDLDIGSSTNSVLLLGSADVKKFHYDANAFFNEVVSDPVRRAQFGQSLSASHPLSARFGLSGEIWHFTQPFLRGNAAGNLWALSYAANKDLVFDGGFDHGLTSTSTHWEVFAGLTYLLPQKIFRR
jgi:hypothetical protein